MTMKRRDALKTIGGLAGAAGIAKFLPGCGGEDGNGRPPGISTIVYLMLENRSYDHTLGARNLEGLPGDGLNNAKSMPDNNGVMIAPFEAGDDKGQAVATVCDPDPPHGWDPSHAQFNAGAMDGFITSHQDAHANNALREPQKYLTRANQPITWALADEYTVCDRWFCSVMGPTLPNRAYWMAATSFGLQVNREVINEFGSGVPVPTIFNRLDEAGVDWCYYFGSLSVVSFQSNSGNNGPFQLDLGPNDGTGRVRRFGDEQVPAGGFFEDCAAGRLPSVVYIDPAFGSNDDHPPVHTIRAQELIASIYTALAKSPHWENCLLVVTYDEHGGYADHVPPPTTVDDTLEKFGIAGFEQMGFRVPTLVIGPYAKKSYVSSVQYDHTSGLKHLQNHFGFAALNPRMEAANDLADCIDQERLAAFDPAPPITLPVIKAADYPFETDACAGSSDFKPAAHDPITEYADENPGAFSTYADARSTVPAYLKGIRNYLELHGVRR